MWTLASYHDTKLPLRQIFSVACMAGRVLSSLDSSPVMVSEWPGCRQSPDGRSAAPRAPGRSGADGWDGPGVALRPPGVADRPSRLSLDVRLSCGSGPVVRPGCRGLPERAPVLSGGCGRVGARVGAG